ncbi:hypothetical protein ACFYYH_05160 [Streptomyces sp. NPDC002018]|uniref:hypothetical protein n=1 Tax=Streptomyces sp. NPDC002018 TaxID=3364629 RepID=UPI00369532AC
MSDPTTHWHGYAWNGPRCRPGSDPKPRVTPVDAQPLSPEEQLRRIAETATVLTTHHTADDAYAWLETTLQEYPRAARTPLPEDVLAQARERLDHGREVDWFYYSVDGRYITRTLDICPGPRALAPRQPCGGCPDPP